MDNKNTPNITFIVIGCFLLCVGGFVAIGSIDTIQNLEQSPATEYSFEVSPEPLWGVSDVPEKSVVSYVELSPEEKGVANGILHAQSDLDLRYTANVLDTEMKEENPYKVFLSAEYLRYGDALYPYKVTEYEAPSRYVDGVEYIKQMLTTAGGVVLCLFGLVLLLAEISVRLERFRAEATN